MVNLQVLNLEGGQICFSNKDLIYLKGLTQLKTLIVISQFRNNPDLTDKALEVAKELKQLEDLRIACCNVTDAGLRHLEGHQSLRSLGFWRTHISDAGLDSQAKLPRLVDVYLGETLVTDAGVKSPQEKIPMCKIRR